MKNKQKFKEIMLLLGEKYQVNISDMMGKMIWESLKLWDDEECEKALKDVLLHGRFYKDLLPDLMQALEGSKGEQATKAWLQVVDAVRRIGPGRSVKFSDPAIHSAIEAMGGWIETGEWLDKDLRWKQMEFEKLYLVVSQRRNHPEYLIGEADQSNRDRGYFDYVKPPVLIGDGKPMIEGPRVKLLRQGERA